MGQKEVIGPQEDGPPLTSPAAPNAKDGRTMRGVTHVERARDACDCSDGSLSRDPLQQPLCFCLRHGSCSIVGRLFDQVSSFLTSATCTLLADRGLSCLTLVKLCQKVGWHYVLRIKNEEQFRQKYRHWYQDWQQGKLTVKKAGDHWYGEVLLWQEHQFATSLSICWEPGYDEAWFLISDQRASQKRGSE